VLKLYREDVPRADVEREAANARAIARTGLATPAVADVVTHEGRVGLVIKRVVGPTMLAALAANPDDAAALAGRFAWLHAEIHGFDEAALPDQHETLAADVARAPDVAAPVRDAAQARLEARPHGSSICHGDFHPLNVIVSADRLWVVDWSKATRGHPDADVARTLMLLRLTNVPRDAAPSVRDGVERARATFLARYLEAYEPMRPIVKDDVMAWMLPITVARLAREVSDNERRQLAALAAILARGQGDTLFFG
jgi:aminoglycoside phosphotransferase (APT) family kinase protein